MLVLGNVLVNLFTFPNLGFFLHDVAFQVCKDRFIERANQFLWTGDWIITRCAACGRMSWFCGCLGGGLVRYLLYRSLVGKNWSLFLSPSTKQRYPSESDYKVPDETYFFVDLAIPLYLTSFNFVFLSNKILSTFTHLRAFWLYPGLLIPLNLDVELDVKIVQGLFNCLGTRYYEPIFITRPVSREWEVVKVCAWINMKTDNSLWLQLSQMETDQSSKLQRNCCSIDAKYPFGLFNRYKKNY